MLPETPAHAGQSWDALPACRLVSHMSVHQEHDVLITHFFSAHLRQGVDSHVPLPFSNLSTHSREIMTS